MRHGDNLLGFCLRWLAMLVVLVVYGFVGTMDDADQLVSEAIEKEARPARAKLLDHPLPYTFTARDCLPSGRGCSKRRFYVPTHHQEEKQ